MDDEPMGDAAGPDEPMSDQDMAAIASDDAKSAEQTVDEVVSEVVEKAVTEWGDYRLHGTKLIVDVVKLLKAADTAGQLGGYAEKELKAVVKRLAGKGNCITRGSAGYCLHGADPCATCALNTEEYAAKAVRQAAKALHRATLPVVKAALTVANSEIGAALSPDAVVSKVLRHAPPGFTLQGGNTHKQRVFCLFPGSACEGCAPLRKESPGEYWQQLVCRVAAEKEWGHHEAAATVLPALVEADKKGRALLPPDRPSQNRQLGGVLRHGEGKWAVRGDRNHRMYCFWADGKEGCASCPTAEKAPPQTEKEPEQAPKAADASAEVTSQTPEKKSSLKRKDVSGLTDEELNDLTKDQLRSHLEAQGWRRMLCGLYFNSNVVERLFSTAKLRVGTRRVRLTPQRFFDEMFVVVGVLDLLGWGKSRDRATIIDFVERSTRLWLLDKQRRLRTLRLRKKRKKKDRTKKVVSLKVETPTGFWAEGTPDGSSSGSSSSSSSTSSSSPSSSSSTSTSCSSESYNSSSSS
eukprot:TRINITY_DN4166_c0_g1_i3.p1 TRINITY_DN4166_c0_g1~~TRINITY_DN4166_c0_g1_i3.p1  ORF type:complete len:521 (+),score=85.43 TRINITY_DN4166_c0_g1_i3:306-1868(+)